MLGANIQIYLSNVTIPSHKPGVTTQSHTPNVTILCDMPDVTTVYGMPVQSSLSNQGHFSDISLVAFPFC